MAHEPINRARAITLLNDCFAKECVDRSLKEVRPSQSRASLFNSKENEIVSDNSPASKKEP
jgi:hypothetical protein